MKKICAIFAAALLCLSITACGRRGNEPANTPTQNNTMAPTIMPTMDTNIPDPSVDPHASDPTGQTNNSNGQSSDPTGQTDHSNGNTTGTNENSITGNQK